MTKLWKWGKRLLWVLAGILILLILSVSILVYLINSEAFLERQIEKQLGMSSQVGELEVSLFSGTVSISETRIGPEDNPAITFDKLTAEISYSGLFSSLLIDSIELDKAFIRYPFDYKLPESNNQEVNDQPFFFERLNVAEIRVVDSDFTFDDDVKLQARGINLIISDLPVAERSIFLFTHLSDFFDESNTTLSADIGELSTDKSTLSKVNLQAKVLEQNLIVEKLTSSSADVIINIDANNASSNTPANTSANVQQTEAIRLPFKDLLVEVIDIGTTNIKMVGQQELSVNDMHLSFAELILVKDKSPLWSDWEDFYQQQNSQYTLSSGEFSSELLSFDTLQMDGHLAKGSFDIDILTIENPLLNYIAETSEASQADDSSTQEQTDIHFPFPRLHLNKFTVTNGSLNLELPDSYKAQSINTELQQLPVIIDHKLVITKPDQWDKKTNARFEASDVVLPQVTVAKVSTDLESESGNLLLSPLNLEGVSVELDLAEVAESNDSTQTVSSTLPLNQILLKDTKVSQLSVQATLPNDEFKVDNAALDVAYFPLMLDKSLFSLDDLSQLETRFQITADSLQTKELGIRSLVAGGNIANSRLVFDSLSNQSGRLSLDLTDPSNQDATADKAKPDTRLPLQMVVINALKLRNFKGDILRLVERLDVDGNKVTTKETLNITDLDVLATKLTLVKNNQLINQWYDSQLEGAFNSVELTIAQVQQDEDVFSDVDIKATQANRAVTINPLQLTINDSSLSADWVIDLSQPGYVSEFEFDFQNLALGQLTRPDNEESISLRGNIDGLAELTFTGLTADSIFSTLNGQILVTNNEPVQLINLNINKVLERFLESQEFGLLDIGGFVLAGPAGLLLSQGVSMQGVLSNLGANQGNTMFGQINIDMTIDKGILKTRDVAASTQSYRFAFDGNIDLSIMAFNDFEFMILNDEGCKEYSQTLNGSLSSPDIQTFRTAFDAVTGSVVGLLKSGVGLLTGGYCEGVYDGKVAHPEKGVKIPQPEIKDELKQELQQDELGTEESVDGIKNPEAESAPESESKEPTQ